MRAQHGWWATEASPCSEHSVWRPQPSPTVRMLPPAVPFLGKPRHLPATFLSQPRLSQGCSSHPFRHPLELEAAQSQGFHLGMVTPATSTLQVQSGRLRGPHSLATDTSLFPKPKLEPTVSTEQPPGSWHYSSGKQLVIMYQPP